MYAFTLNMDTFNQISWYDIVPISPCHVIMGPSWCNYNKVEYSFAHNQYSFFWNRKKYRLSSPLRNYIPFDEPKDVLKSISGSKNQQTPLAEVSLDHA